MEPLFGTPLVADNVPVSPELAALPAARFESGTTDIVRSVPLGRGRSADASWPAAARSVVGHIIALANRATYDSRAPRGVPDWTLSLSMHVGFGQVSVPKCYEAFWTALHIVRTSERGGDMLEIQDPRLPMPMSEDPNLRLRNLGVKTSSWYQPTVEIGLASGMVFLYPSWLDVRYVSRHVEGAGFAVLRAGLIAPLA